MQTDPTLIAPVEQVGSLAGFIQGRRALREAAPLGRHDCLTKKVSVEGDWPRLEGRSKSAGCGALSSQLVERRRIKLHAAIAQILRGIYRTLRRALVTITLPEEVWLVHVTLVVVPNH